MPLLVRLKNNVECYVPSQEFKDLLAEERIVAFKRSGGNWIDPKVGPMRGTRTTKTYQGPERRSRW
jgi:hypothetical protein